MGVGGGDLAYDGEAGEGLQVGTGVDGLLEHLKQEEDAGREEGTDEESH